MKTLKSYLFLLFAAIFLISGNMESFAAMKLQNEKMEVYYFHNTRRCPTCMAIEKDTKKCLRNNRFLMQ